MSPFALDVGQTQVVVQYSLAGISIGMDDMMYYQDLLHLRVQFPCQAFRRSTWMLLMQCSR
jgi:hypothetical protein